MEIVQVKHYPEAELMARLRQVPLQEQPEVKIYQNTLISLECIHTNCLHPPQNYIWLAELRKVQELRWSLQEHGLNMFRLNGFVSYTVREPNGELVDYDLYPPIIEESFEADGTVALLINDGMHRVFLARSEWVVPQVVYVRGIPQEYPILCLSPAPGLGRNRSVAGQPGQKSLSQEMPPHPAQQDPVPQFSGGVPKCRRLPELVSGR